MGTSYKIGKLYFYGKTGLAFNQRSKGFSDEIRWNIETGTSLFNRKLLLLGRMNWLNSLFNGSLSALTSNGSIFANNVEVLNLGAEMIFSPTDKLGIALSYSSPINGRLIYKGNILSGGVSIKW